MKFEIYMITNFEKSFFMNKLISTSICINLYNSKKNKIFNIIYL